MIPNSAVTSLCRRPLVSHSTTASFLNLSGNRRFVVFAIIHLQAPQSLSSASVKSREDHLAQIGNIGRSKAERLGTALRHDVRGVTREEQPTVTHCLEHIGAQRCDRHFRTQGRASPARRRAAQSSPRLNCGFSRHGLFLPACHAQAKHNRRGRARLSEHRRSDQNDRQCGEDTVNATSVSSEGRKFCSSILSKTINAMRWFCIKEDRPTLTIIPYITII